MGLQIRRCHDLGLLSEDQEKRIWINRSRRGWHRSEPLDDSTPMEQPTLMAKSFTMLIESKVRSREQIVKDLNFSPADLESFGGLPEGFISCNPSDSEPHFKSQLSNVIPFRS
jgi:hypothetical protein